MKKCEQCNITYDDSKKFCKKCGNALAGDHKLESKEAAKKQVFEDRLKIDPLNAGLLHEYAQFLFGIGLYKEAITVLLKILALDEKDETAMDLLFKSYQKLEMYKEAGETGKQLLEYRPGDTSLYESLILIFTSLDNSTEVLRLCDHVLDTEPDNTIGLYHKALILLKENDLPNAIGLFKQAYEAGQRGQLTVIYTGIHHVLEAEFEKAVELLLPVVVDIQNYAGNINLQRGSLYLALSLCKISAELPKIRQWVSKVDLNLLKRHHFPQDQKAVLDIILFIFTTSFESLPDSVDAKNEIDQLIKNYLGAGFFTPDHSSSISTLWYNIGTG